MKQQLNLFRPPSPNWGWFLVPFVAISIYFCVFYTIALFDKRSPDLEIKLKLICSIFALFASAYLIAGYKYLVWASALKNELISLGMTTPEIICCQFGRYFINEQYCQDVQFKRLHPRDIEDVYHIINKLKRGDYYEKN